MSVAISPSATMGITAEQLAAAHSLATETRRPVVDVLEQQLALTPGEFVATLAHTLRYPSLTMDELDALTPAFDILPFKDTLKHKAVALRNAQGELLVVFSDPFNDNLHAWAENKIRLPFTWWLAHSTDIDAYLARHEETIHAMDSVLPSADSAEATQHATNDLSIAAINESTSPVVKLVHSTLYDALKMEASDIFKHPQPFSHAVEVSIDETQH